MTVGRASDLGGASMAPNQIVVSDLVYSDLADCVARAVHAVGRWRPFR